MKTLTVDLVTYQGKVKDTKMRRILWLDPDRFDTKPNKSPILEMSSALWSHGYVVVLITGYGIKPYQTPDTRQRIVSLPAINISFLFRYTLMFNMLLWVIINAKKDDIFILNPATLLLSPILRIFSFSNLHLDIRTLPLRTEKSFKKRIDRFLFWTAPLTMFRGLVKGYSFITQRLRRAVEDEFDVKFSNFVIWQSGVNTRIFKPLVADATDVNNKRYKIFYHGSIYGNRGVDKIVEAIALLRSDYIDQICLYIVGPILSNIGLREMVIAKGLSDSVIIEGLVPYEDIPGKIAQADCCICPLPDLPEWNVSSPLKVFEYMACGKPVILTPIPAHKDVAENLDFIVWAKGYQPEDLRDAIEYAFDNKFELSIAAIKGPDYVRQEYDWDVQGRKLSAYLLQSMNAKL